jgi:hypothetical protein
MLHYATLKTVLPDGGIPLRRVFFDIRASGLLKNGRTILAVLLCALEAKHPLLPPKAEIQPNPG